MPETPTPGTIAWTDLTVPDAEAIRDFYTRVTGWKSEALSMCHARGQNASVPPQWLMYIVVEDLDHSIAECTVFGGDVVDGPRPMSGGRFCVIRDPAGAVCGLYAPAVK